MVCRVFTLRVALFAILSVELGIIFMGFKNLQKKSDEQLAKLIRDTSKASSSVIFTTHAGAQMKSRKITSLEVYECLRSGTIRRKPEPNEEKGSLECRMERYISGRNLGVVAAISDEDPSVIVVTAFII